MNENPFKFFDTILEYLCENDNKQITFKELTENVFPKKKSSKDFNTIVENIFQENDKPAILANALLYLKDENLINYTPVKQIEYITIHITQKGIVKIKTNSFSKEHTRTKWNHRIDRFNKLITPAIALCALGLSIYNYLYPNK